MDFSLKQIKKYFPGGIRLWVTLLSLAFVGYSVFINSEKLSELELGVSGMIWLLVGLIFTIGSLVVNGIAWKMVLKWLGYECKNINLISLFLSTNLLKYLPGGVWHLVERIRVLKFYIGGVKAFSSVFVEPLLMAASALVLVPLGGWQSGLGFVCLIPAICFKRRFREPLLARVELLQAGKLKKIFSAASLKKSSHDIGLGRKHYPYKAFVLEIGFVFLRFGGFWCSLQAFSGDFGFTFLQWLSFFSMAWTIGLVVPGAPGGIGIFESVLLLRIGDSLPEAEFIAALLCYRLISTVADILTALAAQYQKRMRLN